MAPPVSSSSSLLLLLHSPREVVRHGGCGVLVDEALDDLPRRVHLVEVVSEHLLFAELKAEIKLVSGLHAVFCKRDARKI